MKIVKVVGTAVSTEKEPRLEASKLLLVQDCDEKGKVEGSPYIAQDVVGAGPGELAMVVEGSSARVAAGDITIPVDAVIVGILDSLSVDGKYTFKK
jgi:ethanolamine utilization protein EutN